MGVLYIINHYGTELSKGLCVLDKKRRVVCCTRFVFYNFAINSTSQN